MFIIVRVLVNSLLVHSIVTSNDAYFDNGWVPVTGPFVFNQMRNRHVESSYTSGWKPTEGNEDDNTDDIKKYGITIITPVQQRTILNGDKVLSALQVPPGKVSGAPDSSNLLPKNDCEYSAKLSLPDELEESSIVNQHETREKYFSKVKQRDEKKKRHFNSVLHRRAPKQVWGSGSTDNLVSSELIKLEPDIKATGNHIPILIKNVTEKNYEVTEPTNFQDLSQETSVVLNEYTNNFINFLSKYGVNGQDMLNNYDRSKLLQYKRLHLHPPQISPVPVMSFHYNSLNHLPPDPLLAVFLSNYGYYLQGFYGQPNNYKNLYGYTASNNIHNNKPFGSYKIYSDTDSSN